MCLHACMLSHFSHIWLFVTLWTAARQAPLSMGILQARILEWVATPSSRGSSRCRDQTHVSYVSCIACGFFTTGPTWETWTDRQHQGQVRSFRADGLFLIRRGEATPELSSGGTEGSELLGRAAWFREWSPSSGDRASFQFLLVSFIVDCGFKLNLTAIS